MLTLGPLRWHLVILSLWTALWLVLTVRHGGVSWHYLREGERLLFAEAPGGGLDLYHTRPDLQIGPVSFLVAAWFSPFPPAVGQFLAQAFMAGLGLVMLVLVGRSAATSHLGTGINHLRLQRRILIAGLAFIPMWVEVAVRFAHLDDVLALFFTTLAVRAVTRQREVTAGILLALAVNSKPWAVAFLPLLLVPPRKDLRRSVAWCVGLVAVAWLPFLFADLGSFSAAKFTIPNQPGSALRWLGVHDPATPPWDRPAQLGLGLALGCCAVWRGRWPAVVLLGANARIVLDPSVYTYYSASVLLGTLIWDAIGQRRLVPWWSWLALISLYGSVFLVPSVPLRGLVRLLFVLASTAYVLLWPMSRRGRGRRTGPAAATARAGTGHGYTDVLTGETVKTPEQTRSFARTSTDRYDAGGNTRR